MAHLAARPATDDLNQIWYYLATESGSVEIANRLIDSITSFLLVSGYPHLGRRRDGDLGAGLRSFPVGEYVLVYCVVNLDVLILRVVHGKRDLEVLFGS